MPRGGGLNKGFKSKSNGGSASKQGKIKKLGHCQAASRNNAFESFVFGQHNDKFIKVIKESDHDAVYRKYHGFLDEKWNGPYFVCVPHKKSLKYYKTQNVDRHLKGPHKEIYEEFNL